MGKGTCQRKRVKNREVRPKHGSEIKRGSVKGALDRDSFYDYHPTNYDHEDWDDQNAKLLEYQEAIEKHPNNKSLTKKVLTKDMAVNNVNTRTENGEGLGNCVFINYKNPKSKYPYAVSADCYNVFADYFAEVIEVIHGETQDDATLIPQFGRLEFMSSIDLNGYTRRRSRVLYSEICIRRNLENFPFTPTMAKGHRKDVIEQVEERVREVLAYSEEEALIPREWDDRMDEMKNDLDECNTMRNYPDDRSMFVFKNKEKIYEGCILNFDDHIQYVCSTNDGRIGAIFGRTNAFLTDESLSKLKYAAHPVFGHLTLSPANVGTGMNVRVIAKFPYLTRLEDANKLIEEFDCEVDHYRSGERSGLFLLTNKKTLNTTEEAIVKNIVLAYNKLSLMEDEMEYTTAMAVQDDTMISEDLFNLFRIITDNGPITYTKKYLTEALVTQYSGDVTNFKSTLNNCVRHNAYFPRSLHPRACDSNCYLTFSRFFDPILLELNNSKSFNHGKKPVYGSDIGDKRYKLRHPLILSYRVRFNRNFEKFPFPMMMSSKDRADVERIMIRCFQEMPVELEGDYCPLKDIQDSIHYEDMINGRLLPNFCDVDSCAGFYRDYPDNRGIFVTKPHKDYDKITLVILINVIDHIKVIALDPSGKALNVCYGRAINMMKFLDLKFEKKYAKKTGYGYLTSVPCCVGCALRVSAMVRLENLGDKRERLEEECIKEQIVYRGSNGHGTVADKNVFDISLKQNLNITEQYMLIIFVQKLRDLIYLEREYNSRLPKPTNDEESIVSDGSDLDSVTEQKEDSETTNQLTVRQSQKPTETEKSSQSMKRSGSNEITEENNKNI